MKKILKTKYRAKLIIGFIYQDEAVFFKAKEKLSRKFGRIDFESAAMDFNYTDYYEPEMGKGLKRRFISFAKLVPTQDLYRIKLYTNRLEKRFLKVKSRQVNIDPGYVDLAKLVLATTKDYAHRIFLRKGIFAEITLTFRGNSFSPNEWTYPDYRTQDYLDIFNQIRKLYTP
ncbi:MAG TPA: DUF4416 family protein [Candidatus Omnitrophota bacterium]|nr:DUF4416 family protein [Candidatus Omnitrophota bacterium]HPT39349.1 DUF4416 family protein [Candidatus Omnitrophota bacterium]